MHFQVLPHYHIYTTTMVRGAEFDNKIPQSDNAIEAGETKAHGVGNEVRHLVNRTIA